ncbi:hypothetical protein CesoFtcFv8_013754 [Champsocephalus esox]|uniref:Uncharacterized protein n=1 Tax=Champsocephalus esox TaxID=159716 RepID=A0AAN8BS03_9TELE|nr:hypothetical protein CesoFtcFv8_013754 [Champsocephalus esox]
MLSLQYSILTTGCDRNCGEEENIPKADLNPVEMTSALCDKLQLNPPGDQQTVRRTMGFPSEPKAGDGMYGDRCVKGIGKVTPVRFPTLRGKKAERKQ